ncbi:ankyrin repeat-containing domain protein, partial [Tuber brumale]
MSERSALFPWVDVCSLEGIADAIENSPGVELRDIHVTEDEDTLLHCAARSGYLEVVKGLVSLGVDANVVNRLGETPLLQASRAGHYEVSRCLMEAGARADKTSIFGEGPIHFLPFFDEQHIDSVSELMIGNGADVNEWAIENPRRGEHGFWGHSPLHYAVVRNHTASVRALLRLGADPYAKDEDMNGRGQYTVLHYAALAGYPKVVNYLLAHTPSKQHLDVLYQNKTPLMEVINMGYRDVFEVLLRHGADIHLTLPGIWHHASYLHICAIAGHRDVFFPEMLLEHGALVDRTDEKGRTPFSVAVLEANYLVADLLLQHGAD